MRQTKRNKRFQYVSLNPASYKAKRRARQMYKSRVEKRKCFLGRMAIVPPHPFCLILNTKNGDSRPRFRFLFVNIFVNINPP